MIRFILYILAPITWPWYVLDIYFKLEKIQKLLEQREER